MRLDRFLANLPELSRRDAQMLIAGGRLRVDGQVVRDGTHEVRVFSRVELDERLLQAGKPARYYMLHKPMGCVSATRDPQHPTVLDLFPEDLRDDLHIGGRLDYNTTGLMLLTNDGQWSRRLTLPAAGATRLTTWKPRRPSTNATWMPSPPASTSASKTWSPSPRSSNRSAHAAPA